MSIAEGLSGKGLAGKIFWGGPETLAAMALPLLGTVTILRSNRMLGTSGPDSGQKASYRFPAWPVSFGKTLVKTFGKTLVKTFGKIWEDLEIFGKILEDLAILSFPGFPLSFGEAMSSHGQIWAAPAFGSFLRIGEKDD
jgi:hypothetical protein